MSSLRKLFIYIGDKPDSYLKKVVSSFDTDEDLLPPQLREFHMADIFWDDVAYGDTEEQLRKLDRSEEILTMLKALAAKMQALETISWCSASYDIFRWLEPTGETRFELKEWPRACKSPWYHLEHDVLATPTWSHI